MSFSFLRQPALLIALAVWGTPLPAADDNGAAQLSQPVYEAMTGARALLEQENYRQAEDALKAMLQQEINPYERALLDQMLGYVQHAAGKSADAAAAFTRALSANLLPENVAHDLRFSLAQLLAQEEQYRAALPHLQAWLQEESSPSAEAHLLAGLIFYQLQDYPALITHLREAIRKAETPAQSWYELLLAGYFQAGQNREAAALLEQMIDRYPDTLSYWMQLAGMYLKAGENVRALATLELALHRGLLDEAGLMQLVRLCLSERLPLKAARLLEEQMQRGTLPRSRENLELLAESWQLARDPERAAAAYSELATQTGAPSAYYRLGYIYYLQEKWPDARAALARAVKGEALEDPADAYLLLGISAFHTHDSSAAVQALNLALGHERTRQQAQWWLDKIARGSGE